jgi:hypothetical protein
MTLNLAPGEDYYKRGNDAWNEELVDLDREIREAMPERVESATDRKGDLITGAVLVKLIAAAVGPLFSVIKSWIQKNPGVRTLDVTWTEDGEQRHLLISATNVDDGTLKAAVTEALKQR